MGVSIRGVFLFFALAGCAARTPAHATRSRTCADDRLPGRCVSVETAEHWVTGPLVAEAAQPLTRGHGHGQLLTVHAGGHDGPTVRLKWKEVEAGPTEDHNGLDGHKVSPRHELAAYAVQQLFLSRDEYVVPPIAARCLRPAMYQRAFGALPTPNVPGATCVFGLVSVWLEDVDELPGIDRQRFESDASYRHHVADLNVLTFLIDHRDTKPANFVIARDPRAPRVFAVDNGMSFSGPRTVRGHFVSDWSSLNVPSVLARTIGRLRAITRPQLDELLVVAQFETDDGELEPAHRTAALSQDTGVRQAADQLQLGLTRAEIDGVFARIQQLLQMVDTGRIAVFEPPAHHSNGSHAHASRDDD